MRANHTIAIDSHPDWNRDNLPQHLADWQTLVSLQGIVRKCGPGVTLLGPDSSANKFYLVESGVIALTHQLSSGRQIFAALRRPGQIFGHGGYLLNHGVNLSASSITDSVLRVLNSQWLIDEVRRGGKAGILLSRQHERDLFEAAALNDLVHLDASSRLERFLFHIASAFEPDPSGEVRLTLALTDGRIAALLGISAQQFSAIKRKLSRERRVQHFPEDRMWVLPANGAVRNSS
jgi:CRP-like cAMP-binding protein